MTIKEYWDIYKEYTKQLSTHSRKLAYAGAAICWFFKSEAVTFPGFVVVALLFVVGFFTADLLQYYGAALTLRFWTRSKEKRLYKETKKLDGDVPKPAWLDYPAFCMFHLKTACLASSFLALGCEFARRAITNF